MATSIQFFIRTVFRWISLAYIAKRLYQQQSSIVKSLEKFIIGTVVDLPQLYDDACPDVQFAAFILFVCGPANVTPSTLEFRAELFLREAAVFTKPPQIIAHATVSSDLLLHNSYLSSDQYWLQLRLVYGILALDIDRDTGQSRF